MPPTQVKPPERDLFTDLMRDVRKLETREKAVVRTAPRVSRPVQQKSGTSQPKRKPRKESSGRTVPIVVALGLVLVLGAGLFVAHIILSEFRGQSVASLIQESQIEMDILRTGLDNARKAHREGDLANALAGYQNVSARANRLLANLTNRAAMLSPGEESEQVQALISELREIASAANEALAIPEIKYGGQGMVEYEGEWMLPEEQQKRFEERMKAEGKQLYEGEYLTRAEIAERRGEVFYNGQYIPKAEYEEIMKARRAMENRSEEQPEEEPEPQPTQPRPPTERTERDYSPDTRRWVISDFEDRHLWRAVPWREVNPCSLAIVEGSESKRLALTLLPGDYDKSAIIRPLRMDLSSRFRLKMDVDNQCGQHVPVAIAIHTDEYYESRAVMVPPGSNSGVTFDLRAGDFKHAPKWSFDSEISHLEQALYLHILIYHKVYDGSENNRLLLDNIVLQGGN